MTQSSQIRAAWKRLRAAARFLAFALGNLAIALLYWIGLPFVVGAVGAVGIGGARGARSLRWRNFLFRAWARLGLRCAGARLLVHGDPPRGPCLLVANHLCYLDVWVLASTTSCTFVAQSEIAAWPFFGALARRMEIVFVARGRKRDLPAVNRAIEDALARGHVIAIFPESTTSDGSRVRTFLPALLESAVGDERTVAWATIGYRTRPPDPPASSAVCWSGGTRLRAHARGMLLLDRIEATVHFGSGVLGATDRKELARELQRRVEARFAPIP